MADRSLFERVVTGGLLLLVGFSALSGVIGFGLDQPQTGEDIYDVVAIGWLILFPFAVFLSIRDLVRWLRG